MEFICIVIIVLIIYMLVMGSCRGFYINANTFSKLWIIIVFVAFIMAFIFEPNPSLNLDLNRLNARLNSIRNFGLENGLLYSEYDNLYVFKYWMYLVSLTECNSILTAIPFTIDVYVFGKIVFDVLSKYKTMEIKYLTFGLFTWISLIGLKLAITDIRCVFAMTICCYGLYLEFINNRSKQIPLLLYIVAIFTHHFVAIFLLIRVLVSIMGKIKSKKKFLVFAFVILTIPMLIDLVIPYLSSNSVYISWLIRKFVGYQDRVYFMNNALSQKLLYISMLIVIIYSTIFSYLNICFYKNEENNYSVPYKSSLALFVASVVLLGFFNNYLMIERGMYIIACLFSTAYLLMPEELHVKRNIYILIPILIYILFINDINTFIVNKLGYSYLRL